MDPLTLVIEIGLLIWALVVWRRHGWKSYQPTLAWTMTIGTFVTNLLLYLAMLPMMRVAVSDQQIPPAALYAFLAFRIVEWAVMVHVFTRLALVLVHEYDIPGGVCHQRTGWRPLRTVLLGLGAAMVASAIGLILNLFWVHLGILDKSIWQKMLEAGATWQAGFIGGLRNLFSEEVVTRLGVQTLLLYHLRRSRWATWAAILLSSLFFEVWHSGGTDFYFINFTASLVFAWVYTRDGYESAAIGHCVSDWLAIALPLWFLS